ncbi:amidase [Rhodococcus sp. B10]|uniref:amidase n=1 Tax=Rhodococcus sp. B10 TaxID=2695876 RepID=UPI0014314934|nr:amidase [Rhodococcus sp. B10]NIL77869.1 Glutamyl-tRNA(Gln) amidotransferase subunit A [Rhodococcus sp. B10]
MTRSNSRAERSARTIEHVRDQFARMAERQSLNAIKSTLPIDSLSASIGAAPSTPGPLDGITVGVKDNIDTAGSLTTMGSTFFTNNVTDTDAPVVRRLRAAGALPIAKTSLAEFAMGATGQNQHYGTVANAVDPTRISGGSSSGSAVAVAAGLVDVALGTDTGGSILAPSALNGVVGLRPSVGRVSNIGVMPVSTSLDRVGPIAPTVEMARRVFSAMAGTGKADKYQIQDLRPVVTPPHSLSSLRIALPSNHFRAEDSQITDAISEARATFEELGAAVTVIHLDGADDAQSMIVKMMFPDFAAVHEARYKSNPDGFGDDVRFRLEIGLAASGVEYSRGLSWASEWRRTLDTVFSEYDVVLTPSTPVLAPLITESTTVTTSPVVTRFTHPWCLSLGPTLTLPCAIRSGLPVGMQLSGPPNSEELLFGVAAQFEQTRAALLTTTAGGAR